jgi:hypothetical protein
VLSRRLRPQRQLEAKIAATKNGQALYHLLRLRLERERDLAQARLDADRDVVAAEEWALRAREDLERTLAEREQAERQLERLRAELVAARTDEAVLERLLREADKAGLLERVLPKLDYEWVDDVAAS